MPHEAADRPDLKGSRAWPIAVTIIVVVGMLLATGLYIFRSLARLPGAAVEQTHEVLKAAEGLAAAFRQGTIETRFVSYATSVTGSSYLQFATVRRMEVFTRSDQASLFWGTVELPEIVVSARAPVEYTAFVDLDGRWDFRLDGKTLTVKAPPIRFNRPAIDTSQIEFEVREGSLLRDEDAALAELQRGLTRMSILRSRDLIPAVRETGRVKVEGFVRNWLLQSFHDVEDVNEIRIDVVFAERAAPTADAIFETPDD